MVIRSGMRKIARVFALAVIADPALVVGLNAIATDKKLKFRGEVVIGADTHVIADDKGKVKSFADVDDLVKAVSAYLPTPSGDYSVGVKTGALLVKPLPSDLIKAAASDVEKLTAKRAAANAVVADLNDQLDLMVGWESGNSLQAARKAEVLEQKDTVLDEVEAIDIEVARLTALIG